MIKVQFKDGIKEIEKVDFGYLNLPCDLHDLRDYTSAEYQDDITTKHIDKCSVAELVKSVNIYHLRNFLSIPQKAFIETFRFSSIDTDILPEVLAAFRTDQPQYATIYNMIIFVEKFGQEIEFSEDIYGYGLTYEKTREYTMDKIFEFDEAKSLIVFMRDYFQDTVDYHQHVIKKCIKYNHPYFLTILDDCDNVLVLNNNFLCELMDMEYFTEHMEIIFKYTKLEYYGEIIFTHVLDTKNHKVFEFLYKKYLYLFIGANADGICTICSDDTLIIGSCCLLIDIQQHGLTDYMTEIREYINTTCQDETLNKTIDKQLELWR